MKEPVWCDRRGELLALALLSLAALLLRLISLNSQLWIDEYTARLISLQTPTELLTEYVSTNQHPLFALLAHISLRAFGDEPWALRLPAVLFGVLTVPALYFCARQVTGRAEALLACALLATSYQHIWFSQNARGYTGMAFWAVLSTGLLLHFIQHPERGEEAGASATWRIRNSCGLYGIAMALGIYTHLAMAFVLVAHALVFLFVQLRRKDVRFQGAGQRPWLQGFGVAVVLSVALHASFIEDVYQLTIRNKVVQLTRMIKGKAPVANTVQSSAPQITEKSTPSQTATRPVTQPANTKATADAAVAKAAPKPAVRRQRIWERPSWMVTETIRGFSRGLNVWAVVLGGVILGAGLFSLALGRQRHRLFLCLLIAPCLATAFAMFVIWSAAFPRFFFFVVAMMMILIARGIVVVGNTLASLLTPRANEMSIARLRTGRILSGGLATGVLLASLLSLRSAYALPKQDIFGAMQYIEAHRAPGDQVITMWPLLYVYQKVFNKPWVAIENAEELAALKPRENVIWTMYSLPQSVKPYRPGVWLILQNDFTVVKVLPGTLGDGNVYVCRSKATRK